MARKDCVILGCNYEALAEYNGVIILVGGLAEFNLTFRLIGIACSIQQGCPCDTGSSGVNTLQVVNMTVLSNEECEKAHWNTYDYYIHPGQICVFKDGNPQTGASACNGDSGGPLVCDGLLAGVTSWGIAGCRHPETGLFWPSVYTRVSFYQPWIRLTMRSLLRQQNNEQLLTNSGSV